MRILSMTATFGKLNHETLTLNPGLNIIDRPNEWGKSTWCAFLIAMLYGIDTSERNTKTSLAAKTRFEPWSGAPMSGKMDILWNNRKITIERGSKGRTPFGIFRAYETDTGLDVPELTSDHCGETLLGVERSVFTRAGFLKLTDLPVEQDEALRRRLNALVTTGDESGTADALEKTLKDLKNRCRVNKKGLLPQAETQRDALQKKLADIAALQEQSRQILSRQQQLGEELKDLENHKQALLFAANATYNEKLAAARITHDNAENNLRAAREAVKAMPSAETIEKALQQAAILRETRDELHTKAQFLPPLPPQPESPEPFRGADPEQAVKDAKLDQNVLQQLETDLKKPLSLIPAIVLAVAAIAVAFLGNTPALICSAAFAVLSVILFVLTGRKNTKLKDQIRDLRSKYRTLPPEDWCKEAERFANAQTGYAAQLSQRENELKILNEQMEENRRAIDALTGGRSLSQFQQDSIHIQELHRKAADAAHALSQAEDVLQALSSSQKEIAPPKYEDRLTLSEQDTVKQIAALSTEQQRLVHLMGNCQGQMESLGEETVLRQQLQKTEADIAKLQDAYDALEIAMVTLKNATQELQRRFAPRISQRATELLSRLTGGRYDRLNLDSDFNVYTGAEEEDATHTALWRSDGTADQLYLALRLAVAQELTPEAPLVLDDALVRFDDTRLASALQILKEESENKQVLLFTCQGRESAALAN